MMSYIRRETSDPSNGGTSSSPINDGSCDDVVDMIENHVEEGADVTQQQAQWQRTSSQQATKIHQGEEEDGDEYGDGQEKEEEQQQEEGDQEITQKEHHKEETQDIVPILEEEAALYEVMVRKLKKRKLEIDQELEIARSKRKALYKTLEDLQERKLKFVRTNIKHLSLQIELQDSLAKSRVRLTRLKSFDEDSDNGETTIQDNVYSNDIGEEQMNEFNNNEGELLTLLRSKEEDDEDDDENENIAIKTNELSSNNEKQEVSTERPTMSQMTEATAAISTPINPLNQISDFKKFHLHHDQQHGLFTFLPSIDASSDLLERMIMISVREASALDNYFDSITAKINICHRRTLIWNTCLDLRLLAERQTRERQEASLSADNIEANEEKKKYLLNGSSSKSSIPFVKDNSNEVDPITSSSLSSQYPSNEDLAKLVQGEKAQGLDPNLTLCPYELDGVCADDVCPYQHLSNRREIKGTIGTRSGGMLQRERLPLPPLQLPSDPNNKDCNRMRKMTTEVQVQSSLVATNSQPKTPNTSVPICGGEEDVSHIVGLADQVNTLTTTVGGIRSSPEKFDKDDSNLKAKNMNCSSGDEEIRASGSMAISDREQGFSNEEDFISLPTLFMKDDSSVDDTVNSDVEDDDAVVSTYLNNVFQSTRSREKIWWKSNDEIMVGMDVPRSVSEWLEKVAKFRVSNLVDRLPKKEDEDQPTEMALEYIHEAPKNMLDYVRWVGRLVDASRVAIHAGRIDFSRSLMDSLALTVNDSSAYGQPPTSWLAFQHHDLQSVRLLSGLRHIVDSAFRYDAHKQSTFHSSFATQLSMAIISEWLFLVSKHVHDNGNKANHDVEKSFTYAQFGLGWEVVEPLIHALGAKACPDTPEVESSKIKTGTLHSKNIVDGLRIELRRKTTLSGRGEDYPMEQQDIDPCNLDILKENLFWALMVVGGRGDDATMSSYSINRIDDGVLKPCWSLVRKFIRRSITSATTGDRSYSCLRAIMLMGYIILGSLERFMTHLSISSKEGEKLSPSIAAALTGVDATIRKILMELSDLVSDLHLGELLLSPLFAASIATATFLQQYAAAQHRLENFLGASSERQQQNGKNFQGFFLTRLSELLWSQLVQLRMSLPCESVTGQSDDGGGHDGDDGNERNSPGKLTTTKMYEWGISEQTQAIHKLMVSRIAAYEILLNHVSLFQDWNLARAMSNHILQCEADIPGNSLPPTEEMARQVENLERGPFVLLRLLFEKKQLHHGYKFLTLRNCILGHQMDVERCFRQCSRYISPLPRSILLAGYTLVSLDLVGCRLVSLPLSFGIYFPKLTVRHSCVNLVGVHRNLQKPYFARVCTCQILNLSDNLLQALPDSITRVYELKQLYARKNKLRAMPANMGAWVNLKRMDVTKNCLESLPNSIDHCSKLEELYLSQNSSLCIDIPDLTLQLPKLRILETNR